MKILFTLNGESYQINTYADKPVLNLLVDETNLKSLTPGCSKGTCGSCIILLDHEPVVSCLIPAFMIRNREILTYEGFAETRFYTDVTRGYENAGKKPCAHCYSAKTLLIESLIHESSDPSDERILDVLSINRCNCLEGNDLIAITKAAAKYRSRRRVRRR